MPIEPDFVVLPDVPGDAAAMIDKHCEVSKREPTRPLWRLAVQSTKSMFPVYRP